MTLISMYTVTPGEFGLYKPWIHLKTSYSLLTLLQHLSNYFNHQRYSTSRYLQRPTPPRNITMSGAKPDLSNFATLRFILNVEDSKGVKHITGKHGYYKKEPLKNVPAGNLKLWLTIDNQNPPPFEVHQITDFKSEENCNGDIYTRVFDTEKEGFLRTFFKPGDDQGGGMMRSALTQGEFHFGDWPLEPGDYLYRVVGPIHFKYQNDEMETQGFEVLQVDLNFWFKIKADSEPASPRENPVIPSNKGYFTEEELKQLRKSNSRNI